MLVDLTGRATQVMAQFLYKSEIEVPGFEGA